MGLKGTNKAIKIAFKQYLNIYVCPNHLQAPIKYEKKKRKLSKNNQC